MAEEIPVRVTPPDGNPMRGDLTDAEIAARNVLPVTNPAGEAIKNMKTKMWCPTANQVRTNPALLPMSL